MGRVAGKTALVTGGARGLGAAYVTALVGEGTRVVIGDVLCDEGNALADQLGDAAHYVDLDVTDPAAWAAAMSQVHNVFGDLNVLINNAGIVTLGELTGIELAEWQAVIDVNQTGTFLGMQAAVAPMITAGGGSIINVSSVEGLRGTVKMHPYVASKWAVRGLTESVALELAPHNIRVNSLHPGFIDSPMTQDTPDDIVSPPLGRLGDAGDVAPMVVFLASDESSYVTAAEFIVDGGLIEEIRHAKF